MFAPIICSAQQHDLRIVALAVLICTLGTATSLRLLHGAHHVRSEHRVGLMLAAGACGGASIWVFHFVSMLAFQPGVPVTFDPSSTLASLVVALGGGVATVYLLLKTPKRWRDLGWGVAFTGAMAAMHYVGMASLRLPGHISWNLGIVVASLGFGVSLSALSRVVAFRLKSRFALGAAAGLQAMAALGLHFMGMAAMKLTLNPAISPSRTGAPHTLLALGVGGLSVIIGLACLWTIGLESRSRRSSLARVHAIINALPQGVACFDESGRYEMGNSAFETGLKQLGVTPSRDLQYRSILSHAKIKADAWALDPAWIDDHLEPRRRDRGVLDHELADGRVLRVETRRTSIGGAITVLSDITDLKRQSADLAAARDAAEAAARAKSQFLANMSHELRTPMNGVIAVADLLSQEPITLKQREMVELMRSSGKLLDRVLRDLLDITQIEAGVLEIVNAPFDVTNAVKEVVLMFAAEASAKDIGIEFHAKTLMDGLVIGDVDRLKQVLTNLVANAVKFTEKGRIDVAVAKIGEMTVFTVADTGIGFDPEQKERLFHRFEQADGSMTRRYGGAGLGLAIARDLATRMGGALTCDSTPGSGSVFFLTLPLPEAAIPDQSFAPHHEKQETDNAEPRILIVDDVPANRQVLSLILDSAGFRTELVENGLEAVSRWREQRFDAILMDIQMPVMDGLTAVRSIRELEQTEKRAATPIIMVSANAMPEHVQASAVAGANGHLAKPITAERLFAALREINSGMATDARYAA